MSGRRLQDNNFQTPSCRRSISQEADIDILSSQGCSSVRATTCSRPRTLELLGVRQLEVVHVMHAEGQPCSVLLKTPCSCLCGSAILWGWHTSSRIVLRCLVP